MHACMHAPVALPLLVGSFTLWYDDGGVIGVMLMYGDRMKLRSNGEDGSLARRNKYFMGEKVGGPYVPRGCGLSVLSSPLYVSGVCDGMPCDV